MPYTKLALFEVMCYSFFFLNIFLREFAQKKKNKNKNVKGGMEVNADWEVGTDGQNPPICDAKIEIKNANAVTITW